MSDSTSPLPENSDPQPLPDAPASSLETSGLAPNVAAGLACLFSLIGGIIFLILEKKNRFVRTWAMQSVFLGALGIAISVVFKIVYLVFGQLPFVGKLLILLFSLLHLVFALGWFAIYVVTVVKSFSNQTWEIPWLGPLARKQLNQQDASVPRE